MPTNEKHLNLAAPKRIEWAQSMFSQAIAVLAATTLLAAPVETYKPAERRHWAFQPRKAATPPPTLDKAWPKTPIDHFILAALEKNGLRPAPAADRITLLRRATFDLHGLPPTLAEIDAFLNDKSPQAWERVVDRLLASPRYGENWARHWLDVVRFAESDGFEYDTHRPDAWRYRDYVVRAFNADKPYADFIREQLAGDEIAPDNDELVIASGFNRLGALRKNAGNQDVAFSRNEVLTEMTNAVGSAFLGVTLGCARCHDHKFDPLRHTDYYRIQGYFAQTQFKDAIRASEDEQKAWHEKAAPIQANLKKMRSQLAKAPDDQKVKLEAELEEIEMKMPAPLPAIYGVANDPKNISPIHVLARGEPTAKGAAVGMRPLGVLLPDGVDENPLTTAAPRTQLAAWVTDPAHPLTARVMVNRLWGYHFGRGIVSTPNDFGRMGTRPSHPDLLDYLANQFIENGWHLKPLHRMILLSSAYRQGSRTPLEKAAMEKDAENALLWKFSPRRLAAEELRDSMLAVAGRLNPKVGGPSVLVPLSPDLIKMLKRPEFWVTTKDAAEYNRRGLYLIHKRNLRLPFMEVFDQPDLQFSCARREQSTHAPQALELLNGELANTMAAALAERLKENAATPAAQVDLAWRLATGRLPDANEKALATKFLAGRPDRLKEFSLAVLNLNAFLYVE
jgi:hypothetical protein